MPTTKKRTRDKINDDKKTEPPIKRRKLSSPKKEKPFETEKKLLHSKYHIQFPLTFFFFREWLKSCKIDLSTVNLQLVGPFELLNGELENLTNNQIHTHWRYYYDLPEFRTIMKVLDEENGLHWGYWNDEPDKEPVGVVSSTEKCEVFGAGNNLFTVLYNHINNKKNKFDSKIINSMNKSIADYCKKNKISLLMDSKSVNQYFNKGRNKKVVAKCFHKFGIVVPMKGDIGYRPLHHADPQLKKIFQKMNDEKENGKKVDGSKMDSLLTCVCLADDEGDPGMGYELGVDFFCSYPMFGTKSKRLLSNAYRLLKREKFIEILEAHLMVREHRNGSFCELKNNQKQKSHVKKQPSRIV